MLHIFIVYLYVNVFVIFYVVFIDFLICYIVQIASAKRLCLVGNSPPSVSQIIY